MNRTTSLGLWTYGEEFLEAAEFIRRQKGEISTVAYYLVCHSIELLLKAFLRGNGYSSHKLKKVIGHDLGKLLKEVRKEDIEKLIHLRDEYLEAIPMITKYYKGKDFEYIETGSRSYPPIDTLLQFARELVEKTRQFCFEQMPPF